MGQKCAIGVDIGGTKIASTIMNDQKEILFRSEVPSIITDAETMFKQVVYSIEQLIEESSMDIADFKGIGVGVPGKIDKENGIAVFQNNLPWQNFPVVKRLREQFSIENVVIDNDVYMATFAEWKASGSHLDETFVYLTISTGISCSIIHQGEFLRGSGFAGEVGLLPVKSPLHPDGVAGFEKVSAGPAIEKWAKEQGWTTEEVLDFYQEDHPEAVKIMDSVFESIAHGVYAIICTIDPRRIVFGGGVMNNHPYLLEKVKDHLKNYLVDEQMAILDNLSISQNKGNAGLIGAGLSVIE